MSFSFDASKAQSGANPPTANQGLTGGTTGAGDAGKMLSPGFTLPSMQSQAKPGGLFGSAFSGTPAPAFGSQLAPTMGLNLGTTTTAAPGTGLSFGTAASTAPTNFNFTIGGGTANTGFGNTNFSIGGLAGTTTATPTSGGLSFGVPKPAATAPTFSIGSNVATPASTAPKLTFGAPTSASTGFSLGGMSAAPAPTTTTATAGTGYGLAASTAPPSQTGVSLATTASTPGFNLTPSTGAQTLGSAFGSTLATPAATTASTGFSLAGATTAPSTGLNLGSNATPAISSGFSLNKTTTTQAASTTVTTNVAPQTSLGTITTVSSASSGQVATMNFCQLEESINKWTLELEEQEKAFVNQATQVNAWDKLLIANGEKIATLNQEVERVKLEQQQLEHELDYVVGQQKELQDCLVPLEKELASLSVSDPERDYTYRLAENLDKQLKQMSQDLKEIIEHLNEANRSQDSSDPIVQIGKILNAHMNSLQWLDQRTTVLGQKIQQIDQMHQNFRQENERSFSLAYN